MTTHNIAGLAQDCSISSALAMGILQSFTKPVVYARNKRSTTRTNPTTDDDVIKWKHFPHCWPFVPGIHGSPVNYHHKGQWRGALMFSLICAWINGWVNNQGAGDLKRHRAHYDVSVMRSARMGGRNCGISTLPLRQRYGHIIPNWITGYTLSHKHWFQWWFN